MLFTESLKQNYEFRRLYLRGKSRPGKYLVVYTMKNGKTINRLGITVGGKIGCAVKRNLIRRRLKEAYRSLEGRLRSGCDIVVVARKDAVNADFAQLSAELAAKLAALGVLVKQ